ncbi:hypothetical protein BLNAU_23767 [Blattamonas nauphoetae]|uniref:Uncharacterized protein n=1 Tax=Blattamonas nauphoetae TaxID=2049346 RepID=A0ABQ9WRD6_9EUKA|nr:hypothetical protein BLNAU_23767 [Blattamonas nauphoetae]
MCLGLILSLFSVQKAIDVYVINTGNDDQCSKSSRLNPCATIPHAFSLGTATSTDIKLLSSTTLFSQLIVTEKNSSLSSSDKSALSTLSVSEAGGITHTKTSTTSFLLSSLVVELSSSSTASSFLSFAGGSLEVESVKVTANSDASISFCSLSGGSAVFTSLVFTDFVFTKQPIQVDSGHLNLVSVEVTNTKTSSHTSFIKVTGPSSKLSISGQLKGKDPKGTIMSLCNLGYCAHLIEGSNGAELEMTENAEISSFTSTQGLLSAISWAATNQPVSLSGVIILNRFSPRTTDAPTINHPAAIILDCSAFDLNEPHISVSGLSAQRNLFTSTPSDQQAYLLLTTTSVSSALAVSYTDWTAARFFSDLGETDVCCVERENEKETFSSLMTVIQEIGAGRDVIVDAAGEDADGCGVVLNKERGGSCATVAVALQNMDELTHTIHIDQSAHNGQILRFEQSTLVTLTSLDRSNPAELHLSAPAEIPSDARAVFEALGVGKVVVTGLTICADDLDRLGMFLVAGTGSLAISECDILFGQSASNSEAEANSVMSEPFETFEITPETIIKDNATLFIIDSDAELEMEWSEADEERGERHRFTIHAAKLRGSPKRHSRQFTGINYAGKGRKTRGGHRRSRTSRLQWHDDKAQIRIDPTNETS